MKAIKLSAEKRTIVGKKVKALRKQGILPVSIFGKDVKSLSLQVSENEFLKLYRKVGETGLIELSFGDEMKSVLVKNVQFEAVSRRPIHVEFHAVNLKEKIKANVPLELVGESPAVTSNVGLALQTLNEVEVEALPANLPEKIEVDIAELLEVEQSITVAQLKAPEGVEILTGPEEVVVKIAPAIAPEPVEETLVAPEGEVVEGSETDEKEEGGEKKEEAAE